MKKSHLILAGMAAIALSTACQEKSDPVMTLSTKELEVSADGGTATVDLTTNVYYRVNNDCTDGADSYWAVISGTEKNGDVTTFTLTVEPNPVAEVRSGRIRFIGDGVTPLALTIKQKALVPVGVSESGISVGFTDTEASFTVLGDKPWTASCDNPEFTLSATQGTGETKVTVTFPQNESYDPRTATVTVTINGKDYTVTITQDGAPRPEYTDLSADGTANCYIISKVGYYKFNATVRGNGTVPASQSISATIAPASAKVLWSSFNTDVAPADDNAIITDVELVDGFVQFTTASLTELVEGNAVVAAYDESGNIIWSWHIWVTVPGADVVYGGSTWMDRNVGALAPNSYLTVDPLACGLYFQWGRKDPMRGSFSYEAQPESNDMATTGTWPAPQLTVEENGNLDFAIKNPQVVLYAESSSYNNKDWFWGVQYDDLWGGAVETDAKNPVNAKSIKTMFDPCPAGYCVPTALQLKNVAFAKSAIDKDHYGIGSTDFWLTYAGGLLYDQGVIGNIGTYCFYASSSTSGVNALCIRSHTTAVNFGGAASGRTAGYSVRCVKE